MFEVNVPSNAEVNAFIASAETYPTLRDLRAFITQKNWKIRVYRDKNIIFGYGEDAHELASRGFQQQMIKLFDYPRWCARLITEGLADHLKDQGYHESLEKVHTTLYESRPYGSIANGKINVFRGYTFRTIYLWKDNQPVFGLIVDVCWKIEDENGRRLNTAEIAQYNAISQIAQIQDELLPNNKINLEASRLRLYNHILPFINMNRSFTLPLSERISVSIEEIPVHVILGI